ncbi:MAG: hypothetical protein M3P06_00705 [Acidobacteriota bacterium]|nr:hypothetical protein [Acidobacteriota bacterium]
MFRAHAPDREPGLTLEMVGASMRDGKYDVDIRLSNPAGAGNVVTALYLESAGKLIAAEGGDGTFKVPFAIQANGVITGRLSFRAPDQSWRDGAIVVIDVDGRLVSSKPR